MRVKRLAYVCEERRDEDHEYVVDKEDAQNDGDRFERANAVVGKRIDSQRKS